MSDDDDDDTAASYNTADDFTLQPNDVVFSRAASLYRKHPGNMAYWDLVDECCFQMGRVQDRTTEQYKEMIEKLYKFVIHQNKGRFINHNGMLRFDILQRKEANKKIRASLRRYRLYYFMGSPAAVSNRRKSGAAAAAASDDDDESTSDDDGTTTGARKSSLHRNMDESNEVIPFAPQTNDIIYGINDKATMKHPGNVHFRSLLSKYYPRLEKATDPTAQQYRDMASEILHVIVHQRKGRFLRPTDRKGRFQRKIVVGSKRYCQVVPPTVREYKVRCALYKHRALFRNKKLPRAKSRNKNTVDSDSVSGSDRESSDEEDDDDDDKDNDDDSVPRPPPKTTRRMCGRSLTPAAVADNDDEEDDDDDEDKDYMEDEEEEEEDDEEGLDLPTNTNGPTNNHQFQYGSQQALMEMRRWLNQHRLPLSVGETLESHGVRDTHDVRLSLQLQSDVLEAELLPLDFYKLRRAVESMDGNGN